MINITLAKYKTSRKAQRYDALLHALKPKNLFSGRVFNLDVVSYKAVREIEALIVSEPSFENLCRIFERAFGVTEEEFYDSKVTEFFAARNFLVQEIKTLRKNESILLKSISMDSVLWDEAGGQRLNVFGSLMPLSRIGRIYGVYPFDLQNRPYNEVLTLLVLHKTEDEVKLKYNELKNPKKPTK